MKSNDTFNNLQNVVLTRLLPVYLLHLFTSTSRRGCQLRQGLISPMPKQTSLALLEKHMSRLRFLLVEQAKTISTVEQCFFIIEKSGFNFMVISRYSSVKSDNGSNRESKNLHLYHGHILLLLLDSCADS